MLDIDGSMLYNHSVPVGPMGPDSAAEIFVLPQVSGLTSTYFLKLTLYLFPDFSKKRKNGRVGEEREREREYEEQKLFDK